MYYTLRSRFMGDKILLLTSIQRNELLVGLIYALGWRRDLSQAKGIFARF